jgi:hypothetical protein
MELLSNVETINKIFKIDALHMTISKEIGRKVTTKKDVAAYFELPREEKVYVNFRIMRDLLPRHHVELGSLNELNN